MANNIKQVSDVNGSKMNLGDIELAAIRGVEQGTNHFSGGYKQNVTKLGDGIDDRQLTEADCGYITIGVVGAATAASKGYNIDLPTPASGLWYKIVFVGPSIANNSRRLLTGYVKDITNISDRPLGFDAGFFVEDYKFLDNGDLDKYNGRYAKTLEFPNGVYAYYAAIDLDGNPEFPYFIGECYRSNTLEENKTLDQTFDFNNSDLLRNTFPHKISDEFANNDFIVETNEITRQKNEAAANGYTYEGPNSPFDEPSFKEWWDRENARCMTIGVLPTSMINGGNASVVNGTVVYDSTP